MWNPPKCSSFILHLFFLFATHSIVQSLERIRDFYLFHLTMNSQSLPRVNSQLTPILLKGHERSITTVKYNNDGDLLFSASKDLKPTVWYADTGERLGTYSKYFFDRLESLYLHIYNFPQD